MKKRVLRSILALSCCFGPFSAGARTVDDTLQANVSSRFLAFPLILRSPETGWGFGLATAFFFKANHWDDNLRTSDINLVSLYTEKEQFVMVLGSTVFFPHENQIFRFQGSYSYYPDKTWGIGNNSEPGNLENYQYKQYFFNPQILQKIFRGLYIGGGFEVQRMIEFNYVSNGVFQTENIPGRLGGYTSGIGLSVAWDKRNNAYSPGHGFFGEFNYGIFDKTFASDYSFHTMKLDLRKFFSYRVNNVIALQAYFRSSEGTVPVRYLSMLGGTELMRGYYQGRYTDKSMMVYQAEWRRYLFWKLGLAAFASMGEVGNKIEDFRFSEFHYAAGAGLRLMVKEKEKLNLRIDYGIGENSNGLYVTLKEAF